jgi:hypothetical protein
LFEFGDRQPDGQTPQTRKDLVLTHDDPSISLPETYLWRILVIRVW